MKAYKRLASFALALVFTLGLSAQALKPAQKAQSKANISTEQNVKSAQAAKAQGLKTDSQFVVIDFNATWCGPCKRFAPTFEKIGKKYASKAQFKSIDIDANPQMAEQYGVQAIPCVVVLKGGKVVAQNVGLMEESEFDTFVKNALAK